MNDDINKNNLICPICGEVMEKYDYAYDQNQFGKIYFKCNCCGHKSNIIESY